MYNVIAAYLTETIVQSLMKLFTKESLKMTGNRLYAQSSKLYFNKYSTI